MSERLVVILFSFLISVMPMRAQTRLTMGFYNVENFFDTTPSSRFNDADFTLDGRNRWDEGRYGRKLENISRVIDDMCLDVIALAEVEGEAVVRDIVTRLGTDYNYICRRSGDRRGMDIALLYKGDKFVPETVRQIASSYTRRHLYVRGLLAGRRVDVIVCHMPSMMNKEKYRKRAMETLYSFADSLHRADPASSIVIMGDFNAAPSDRVMRKSMRAGKEVAGSSGFMFNPLAVKAKQGFGSYAYDGRWMMYDNIFLDLGFVSGGRLRYRDCGVFVKDYMLDREGVAKRGYPLRTFSGGRYTAGFSDHLPVFVELELVN